MWDQCEKVGRVHVPKDVCIYCGFFNFTNFTWLWLNGSNSYLHRFSLICRGNGSRWNGTNPLRSTVSESTLTISTLVRLILPRSTQIFSKSTHTGRFLGTAIWVWLIQVKLTKWGTNYSTVVVEKLDCGPKGSKLLLHWKQRFTSPFMLSQNEKVYLVCFGPGGDVIC